MIVTVVAGINHEGATVRGLCRHIAATLRAAGDHDVRLFDLWERPVPFFSEADRAPDDDNVRTLRRWVDEADALVLATPEYHGSISGVLKNALDHLWKELDGKVVMSVSVAGGPTGVSSLQQLQTVVRSCHAISSPEWISLGRATKRLRPSGEPEDEAAAARVRRACAALLTLASKVRTG